VCARQPRGHDRRAALIIEWPKHEKSRPEMRDAYVRSRHVSCASYVWAGFWCDRASPWPFSPARSKFQTKPKFALQQIPAFLAALARPISSDHSPATATFNDNLDQKVELLPSARRVINRLEGLCAPALTSSVSAKSPGRARHSPPPVPPGFFLWWLSDAGHGQILLSFLRRHPKAYSGGHRALSRAHAWGLGSSQR
jgi:hypothetical protein